MDKEKLNGILDFYNSSAAYTDFLLRIIYNEKPCKNIIDEKLNYSARIGFISNILSATKEDVINDLGKRNYESKLFENELEKTVDFVLKKDGNGYILDGYRFKDAATVIAELRNKLEHGNYILDIDNKNIIFNINNTNVSMKINKLERLVIMTFQNLFKNKRCNEYKREIFINNQVIANRTTPIKSVEEVEKICRSYYKKTFVLRKKDGGEINRLELSKFYNMVNLYEKINKQYIITDYEKTLSKDYELIVTNTTKPEGIKEFSKAIYNIMPETDYSKQVFYIGTEMDRHFDERYEKFNSIFSNISNLSLLRIIYQNSTVDINQIIRIALDEYNQIKISIGYDNLASSAMTMFNSLFTYSNGDLYRSTNLFTHEPINGLHYENLDLSKMKVLYLDNNCPELESKKKDKLKLDNSISKYQKNILSKEEQYNNVSKNNKNVKDNLSNFISDLKGEYNNLLEKQKYLENKINSIKDYYNNNINYFKNKSIITGIRDAIAHGNYHIKLINSIEESIIVFEDIYKGKLYFKGEIKINDFIFMIDSNVWVVKEFINSKIQNYNSTKVL